VLGALLILADALVEAVAISGEETQATLTLHIVFTALLSVKAAVAVVGAQPVSAVATDGWRMFDLITLALLWVPTAGYSLVEVLYSSHTLAC
jgi:hypothetical protein